MNAPLTLSDPQNVHTANFDVIDAYVAKHSTDHNLVAIHVRLALKKIGIRARLYQSTIRINTELHNWSPKFPGHQLFFWYELNGEIFVDNYVLRREGPHAQITELVPIPAIKPTKIQ